MRTTNITLLTILISFNILAQDHFYKKISTKDGLPHNTVNTFTQDSLGFIWIGTDNGLVRYDNHQFEVFDQNNKGVNQISNNQVLSSFIDRENYFWVGTANSIERYDKDRDQFISHSTINPTSNFFVPVLCINQYTDSLLIIGTDGGGLQFFDRSQLIKKSILTKAQIETIGYSITDIFFDPLGHIWITSKYQGVHVFNKDFSKRLFHIPPTQPVLNYTKTVAVNASQVAVASYGKGLQFININTFDQQPAHYCDPHDLQSLQIFDLLVKENQLHIATDGGGIYTYHLLDQSITQEQYDGRHHFSIGSNVIRKLFLDREQNLWIGHYQGGISILRNKKAFKGIPAIPNHNNALNNGKVTSILPVGTALWVGTDGGGLNIVTEKNVFNNENKGGLPYFKNKHLPSKILCMKKDSRGLIWLGTYLEGAFIYNPKTALLLNAEVYFGIQLNNQDIRCIFEDKKGNIWLGTNGGGVNIIDIKKRTVTILQRDNNSPANSLSMDWVRCIEQDSYGYIWIGTSYGLNSYDPINQAFIQYLKPAQDSVTIINNFIGCIKEDQHHVLWVGTGGGLFELHRQTGSFKRYTKTDGLASDIVTSIAEDQSGNLWVGTNNGLTKINPQKQLTNYTIDDGLISNAFLNNALFEKKDTIMMGTHEGLTYFQPSLIEDKAPKIPVVFRSLKILNEAIFPNQAYHNRVLYTKPLAYTTDIEIQKEENVLTFEFSALTYAYPEKVIYEYQLLGFQEEWIALEGINLLTYTNLKAGSYTLGIRVKNLGTEQPTSKIHIKVLPPFYETWWFRSLALLLISAIVFTIFWYRYDRIKKEKDLLEKKYELRKIKSEQDQVRYEKLKLETALQKHEVEVDLKNTQLVSSTLLMTNKNDIMNQVKAEIQSFSKNVVNKEVKLGMEKLLKTIDKGFKIEDDWERFEKHFDEVHKDFFKRVKKKYPDLTLTYLKLIAYLRMDLTTKEIASLLNISVRGVEKSRYRLRQKLNLNSGENLTEVIAQL